MRKIILVFIVILLPFLATSQDSLDELLDQYNNESIPYITASELSAIESEVILLDARELKEYQISHLKGAIHVGYDHFDINTVLNQNITKDSKIIVYCSLGIRSEDVSEKLMEAGYYNIFNLYGGIFEWKNEDYQVVDSEGNETDKIHAFSKQWGKWLHKGKKTYKK